MAGNSRGVVIAALIANGAIAVMKFVGFLLTGSAAMLSETYHSVSDTGNQVFLLIGIRYGGRAADGRHPFGYGKAQFFYSFLVSVLLFGIAGWESAKHGYNAITHGGAHRASEATLPVLNITFDAVLVNYTVLVGAIAFESWALWKANKEMKRQIELHGWSGYREAFRKTSDVTTLTAFTEDMIALAGAGIALFGIYLSRVTGNSLYDAASALIIGLMLMGFAVALAWENKRLLLGESLPNEDESGLLAILKEQDGVADVADFRTVYFGPANVVVTADVSFDPGLETEDLDDCITAVEKALIRAEPNIGKVYIEPETEMDPGSAAAG
jgi:cation diffusion facilitator family transporter